MKRITHEQRARRRAKVKRLVADGMSMLDAAGKFGITTAYVRQICQGVVATNRSDLTMRRIAATREFASLGISRRRAAELLHIWPQTLSAICTKNDIAGFSYDKAGWQDIIDAAKSRADIMAALYRDGYTLQQISEQYGITRERVRQLLAKYNRMNGGDGGKAVRAQRALLKRVAAKDAKYLKSHGCTWAQWQEVRDLGGKMRAAGKGVYQTPLRAYINQRNNARHRKVGWELNFWQWWTIWQQSGRWEQRGLHAGEYVMCRNGDVGPYAVGNVFIALSVENISTGNRKKHRDLPVGVSPTKSGRFSAHRRVNGKTLGLGTHDTPELAYAAYLMAAPTQGVAA